MKNVLAIALAAILILFVSYQGCQKIKTEESFKATLDSLNQKNDSLLASIDGKEVIIDSLEAVDSALVFELENQKPQIIKIVKLVDSSKQAIDTYSEGELVASFNKRYPDDTLSNPLPLAQPVLVSAAKDLVEFDGAKELLVVKDSTIALQQERINNKDLTIREYISKEDNYRGIIINKDLAINTWGKQYDQLQKENKKLQKKFKIQKTVFSAIIGGLAIFLIAK